MRWQTGRTARAIYSSQLATVLIKTEQWYERQIEKKEITYEERDTQIKRGKTYFVDWAVLEFLQAETTGRSRTPTTNRRRDNIKILHTATPTPARGPRRRRGRALPLAAATSRTSIRTTTYIKESIPV
jgi:hypothetical protein